MKYLNLHDYSEYSGETSGHFDQKDVELLYKAMSAGETTGAQTWDALDQSGAPLKVESLESTMKILTATSKHIALFREIAKKPATNTAEEYLQLYGYGDWDGGFTVEGELPEVSDSVYRRKVQHVKYMGITGGVTLPMQLVQTGGGIQNMLAQEVRNKSQAMAIMMEKALPFADSRVVPENFNGFLTQHEMESDYISYDAYIHSPHVIDARGGILKDEHIELASQVVVTKYGIADTIISHPAVFSNYNRRFYDKKWITPTPGHVRDGVYGNRVNEIFTQNGAIRILQSNYFKRGEIKNWSSPATSSKAPSQPVNVTSAINPSDLSKFVGGTEDTYYYAVAGKNRHGESALKFVDGGALIAAVALNAIDLIIDTGGSGSYAPTGYAIYRSEQNPKTNEFETPMYKIFEVSVSDVATGFNGAAAGAVRDNNYFIANTDQAWVVEWDPDQVLALKQLAPLMKLNLAVTAPVNRFMVLLYSTPILYAPLKTVRIINLGTKMDVPA